MRVGVPLGHETRRTQAGRHSRRPDKENAEPAGDPRPHRTLRIITWSTDGWRGGIYEPPSWRKPVTWYACPMSTGFENEARWDVPWPRPRSFLCGLDLSAGRSSRAGRDFQICPARDVALSRLLAGRRGLVRLGRIGRFCAPLPYGHPRPCRLCSAAPSLAPLRTCTALSI